jgi:hypothetical protein
MPLSSLFKITKAKPKNKKSADDVSVYVMYDVLLAPACMNTYYGERLGVVIYAVSILGKGLSL